MSIVIFGATGHLGRLTVEHLLARGVAPADIVATGRAVDKLADLADQGVEVTAVDRNDPAAVAAVLHAGDRVLLVSGVESNRVDQHRTIIDAAVAAGVGHLVYTSGPHAQGSSMLLMADHGATEALLAEAAIPSTVLRNAWYVENYTGQVDTYRAHGMVGAAGDGQVSLALRSEYAEAAAVVLTTDAHAGKVYELGGAAATLPQIAALISEVIGEQISYTNVDVDTLRTILAGAGVPAPMDAVFADVDRGIADGELLVQTDDLETLLGRAPLPLEAAFVAALS